MEWAEKAIKTLRDRLPQGGESVRLRDAVAAMEAFCSHDPLRGDGPTEDDEEGLVIVVSKQNGEVEIGLYRNWGWFHRLELLLRYRSRLRTLFLGRYLDGCVAGSDPQPIFDSFRNSGWYRRFAALPAASCSVHWQGPDEMVAHIKVLAEAMGPGTCDWTPE